ncbi:hypothetical protein Y032_0626g827 [Ancylostoma ceylanicum]|uniref:Uncharacterized protein n=1 Tax=Ancylostoma ceylanicum TaxID=53326 RepID=A0A016WLL6_9BILA|nr:hypothetical protein Y032_0626g827 [Ancylostoma ceylanicum]
MLGNGLGWITTVYYDDEMETPSKHQENNYYEALFTNSIDLFKAMDKTVTQYTVKIDKLFSPEARRFGMLLTVILECTFHFIFESQDLKAINPMIKQWAEQYVKLGEWARNCFDAEFPYMASDLKGGSFHNFAFENIRTTEELSLP